MRWQVLPAEEHQLQIIEKVPGVQIPAEEEGKRINHRCRHRTALCFMK